MSDEIAKALSESRKQMVREALICANRISKLGAVEAVRRGEWDHTAAFQDGFAGAAAMLSESPKAMEALSKIAADYKTYKGDGNYDEGPMSGEEAQKIARAALTAYEKAGASPSPAGGMLGEKLAEAISVAKMATERADAMNATMVNHYAVVNNERNALIDRAQKAEAERAALSSEITTLRGALERVRHHVQASVDLFSMWAKDDIYDGEERRDTKQKLLDRVEKDKADLALIDAALKETTNAK